MKSSKIYIALFFYLVAVLSSCATQTRQKTISGLSSEEVRAAVEKKITVTTPDIKKGMEYFQDGNYVEASRSFSRALKYDPKNGGLHFLNGLCYHLLVELGDTSQIDLAEIGYNMAMEFDPSNFWSARFMGHLRMTQKKYPEARDFYAKALQTERNHPELLLDFARAAYYAQDLATATAAITQAEKLDSQNPRILSAAAMIYAAAGDFEKSGKAVDRLSHFEVEPAKIKFLSDRIQDWRSTHAHTAVSAANKASAPRSRNIASEPSKVPRMVTIDVVLIRSDEVTRTNKGVNLLNGLALQYSSSNTQNRNGTNVLEGDLTSNVVNTSSRALTSAISVPAVTYNLNIFNDNDAQHEVLARPTLISMDGKPSTFFSGSTLNVALEGGIGSTGALQAIPIGVNLSVTPQFIDDETVKLEVDAGREFVEEPNTTASFNKFVQTSKNKVNVNVVMKFEETLIVSGMSEKASSRVRDGVPFLRDIPFIQYFFSNEKTLDFNRSVLILMTPHKPRLLSKGTQGSDAESQDVKNLRKRVDWFAPTPTADLVLRRLASNTYYTEFRSGDIESIEWNNQATLKNSITRALRFLYF